LVALERVERLAVSCVPEPNVSVPATRGEESSIRTEHHRVDAILVPFKREDPFAFRFLGRRCVPDTRLLVKAGGEKLLAIRRKHDAANGIFMAAECNLRLAGDRVPEPDGLVETRRRNPPAIGTESDTSRETGM